MPCKLSPQERHMIRQGLSKLGGRAPKWLARAVAITPKAKAKAKGKARTQAKAKAKGKAKAKDAPEQDTEVVIVEEDEPDPPMKMKEEPVRRVKVEQVVAQVKVEQLAAAARSSREPAPPPDAPPSNAEVKELLVTMGRSLYEVSREIKEFNGLLQQMAA
eukprot:6470316-Amphidinium_carterae.2